MSNLSFRHIPSNGALGDSYPLPLNQELFIGSDSHRPRRSILPLSGLGAHQWRIRLENGVPILEQGTSPKPEIRTNLNGITFASGISQPLHDGWILRIGSEDFVLENRREREEGLASRTLSDWVGRAIPAPDSLNKLPAPVSAQALLVTSAGLCITSSVPRRQLPLEEVREIYGAYRNFGARTWLPICLTYLIDLAGILLFDPPAPLMTASRASAHMDTLRNRYLKAYQDHHICILRDRPAISFVRQRVAKSRSPDQQAIRRMIIARFTGLLWSRIESEWRKADARRPEPAPDSEMTFDEWSEEDPLTDGSVGLWSDAPAAPLAPSKPPAEATDEPAEADEPARNREDVLLTSPLDIMGFLAQVSGLVAECDILRKAFDELELFLLAALTQEPTAFENFDAALISECLKSRNLENQFFDPDRITLADRYPEIPSPTPGEQESLRSIRVTNRLEKLPEVIPQELVTLRCEPHGREQMLQKLLNNGLNIWERKSYDEILQRNTFLLVLVADIGLAGQIIQSRQQTSRRGRRESSRPVSSTSGAAAVVHARRLIFEILRDFARFAPTQDISLDVHVLLEPVGTNTISQISWETNLRGLQQFLGSSRLEEDMLNVETNMSGYFFQRPQRTPRVDLPERLHAYWERGQYEAMSLCFLAPERTLFNLVPDDPPGGRSLAGVLDTIHLVRLNPGSRAVEVCRGPGFDVVLAQPVFEYASDEQLRIMLLESILGRRRAVREHQEFGVIVEDSPVHQG